MNVVYLIGNGFDLNLGLKTAYTDFIEDYSKIGATKQSSSVRDFINFIKKQKDLDDPNWSDIELQMGRYTASFTNGNFEEQAKLFHEDLTVALSEYMKTQCGQILHTQEIAQKFCAFLVHPEKYSNLLQNELIYLTTKFRRRWEALSRWDLKIITFNYTNTIETLISEDKNKPIGAYYPMQDRGKTFLTAIEHIHGYVDDRLIVGVDDATQISNEQLRDSSAMNWYIKSRGNEMTGEMHAERCRQYIANANLICVFGFSFGLTDQQWWKLVLKRILTDDNARLIIYIYAPNISFTNLQYARMNEYKQQQRAYFIKQSGVILSEKQQEIVNQRIYIALNSEMFDLNSVAYSMNIA